ncbi:PAS domain S-box protein [Psychroserpens luteus]|uniref:PAS domain S-box protein n=1 Tax=Psychroserpens luteus TaxID=1434066 RepID=A0ABW5ZQ17_9FLAO|nr:PAS domain S-box protein [Psychroserpens luteus]
MDKKTILIVDDTFENLYLLRVILEEAGYTIIEAKDGSEGLKKLHENRNVDLIISDILMPIMDGYLFCQACKKDKLFKKIPFVFYTSNYTEKLDEDFALKLGATKFLRKPIEHDEFLTIIKDVFEKEKTQVKYTEKIEISDGQALKLYSERLINKLEQKSLDLGKEVSVREKAEQLLINENEILDLIAVNTPLDKIFERLLLNYESLHPNYFATISLLDDDGSHLNLESAPSMPKAYSLAIKRVAIDKNTGSCGRAVSNQKPVIASDISTDKLWANYKDLALKHDLKSCWSVPILSKTKTVLGIFAIYSNCINTPSLEEIRELNLAVNLVNIAIEKSRIVAEIQKKDESYRALLDQVSDPIITYTLDGTVYDFNKASYISLGYSKEEFLKLKIQDFLVGDLIVNQDLNDKLLNGVGIVFDRQLLRKDKSLITVEISAKLQKDGRILGVSRDVTERKRAEEKLLESEYNLIQSQIVANIGSYIVDLNTMTWECSNVLDKILGIDESYVKTVEGWNNRIHPDERKELLSYFKYCIANNKKFDKEYRVLKLDTKEEIWVHGIGELLFDDEANPTKMIGTIQDITSRKLSEILLQESEKSLLIAQKIAKIGSFDLTIKKSIGETSVIFNEIIGVDSDTEVDFDLWKSIVHPEDRPLIKKGVIESLNLKQKFSLEYRIFTKDNKKLKWIHGLGEIVYSNGKATNFVGTIQDITERKNTELELKIANEFSSSLLKSMNEGLFAINLDSEIISVNPAFCKMTGFTEKELIGLKRPYPFSPPELKKENDKRYELLIQNKNKENYENIYMRKSGERFPVHVMVSSLYDEHGIKTANFATIQDITERRKAETSLRLAKEFNDKLVMSMQEGLLMIDLSGKIIKVNESLCHILGYSEQELIGLELPYPFAKAEDFIKMQDIKSKVAIDESPSFQLEFFRKNGEQFIASFLAGTIKNDDGEVMAMFATIKDISEEEKAKNILKETAKKSLERKNIIIELASLVGTDYKEALNKITALSAKTLNVERGSILKFNEEKTEMICEKLYTKKSNDYESGQVYSKKGNDKFFDTLIENKTVVASNAISHELSTGFIDDYLIPLNIKSKLSIPIQGLNGVYGILCFEQVDTVHVWTADEEEFAISLANLVSLMVESSERKLAEDELFVINKELSDSLDEIIELKSKLEQENNYLRNELDLVFNYEEMVYGSEEFGNVLTEIEKVAPTDATVLLLGESGTGKELLARAIHNISNRNNKPLIKVNCSAIPRELLESELFGHKKGSFTGAYNDKVGKFELADNGTLFLDEIGEMPLDMQPKILRFLQEGEIEVVGDVGSKKLNVRVIAATNRNLKEAIEKKEFREDLFFRLNVFPVDVPPLSKRKNDIPLLVEHFVDKFNKAYGKNIKYIADDAMSQLQSYNWPGNIRELENLIERASILSTNDTLLIPGFESTNQKSKSKSINSQDLSLDTAQRNHILQVLEQCNWKISGTNGASALLKLKPSTLRDRMQKLGLKKQI